MKRIIAIALLTLSTSALAGPKALRVVDQGETADGRTFVKMEVTCSGSDTPSEIFQFGDSSKWCLADESYCGRKMNAAKKSCKLL